MPASRSKPYPNIFICYRREDSAGHAGRLHDYLVRHFSEDQVFIDLEQSRYINPGEDFIQIIEDTVRSCNILLVLIGQQWLSISSDSIRRLDDLNDLVRMEIITAIDADKLVIPVVVHGATMPKRQDLPDDLVKLARLQAINLNDLNWKSDVNELIEFIKKKLNQQKETIEKENFMAGKKVFVSYDHSEDVHYKRLLQAWDANTSFDFDFDSRGPDVPINSTDAARIQAALTTKMKEADYLLVIVGEKTYTSKWVTWEIEQAKSSDVKLKLAAVKINRNNTSPGGLTGVGTSWASSFTLENIVAALNGATNNY